MKSETHSNYIPVQSALNWDEYFMLQAIVASFKSKDPVTKVGSVFVDKNNHQITMGYNGMVAGIDEAKLPWGKSSEFPLEDQKYGYVVHSEANAILHAPRSLQGSTCYVTLFPCHECAKLIASAGVKKVFYLYEKNTESSSHKIALKIFELTQIEVEKLSIKEELINNLAQHMHQLINKE